MLVGVIPLVCSCNDSSNTHAEAYFYPIVVMEADNIRNFPSAKLEDVSVGEKYGNAWSARMFSVDAEQFDIEEYYDKELTAKGWKRYAIRKSWAFLESREYCKGKIKLILELRGQQLPSKTLDLGVGVSWARDPQKNCEDNGQLG